MRAYRVNSMIGKGTIRPSYLHPFHIVTPSPWPLYISLFLLQTVLGAVMYFHGYSGGALRLWLGVVFVIFGAFCWFRDIIRESTYTGQHTYAVQRGLRMGFALFIVSEIMFFFGFFWAFFHSSLSPAIQIGAVWPPVGIQPFDPWGIPFLNTLILLLSGAFVTWAHYALLSNKAEIVLISLFGTVALGVLFTCNQLFEYITAPFSINDGIYGSTFFMTTGFHGLHVLVGTIFLIVCWFRTFFHHFRGGRHHVGFEAAIWYWHFVDVVWLFLFVMVYWWGS